MVILKRWRDDPDKLEADGLPVGWFETTLEECLEHTEGAGYWKPGSVLALLEAGQTVATPWAEYRMLEEI